MFRYLRQKDGPVFPGLEQQEVVYAANQPQYTPLRTLVSAGIEKKVLSRWALTEEQRKAVADGADIFLQLHTFGAPLQPVVMALGDGTEDLGWVRFCLLDVQAADEIIVYPNGEIPLAQHMLMTGKDATELANAWRVNHAERPMKPFPVIPDESIVAVVLVR